MNKRQQLFVKEYLKDLNATQAAIRSGYSKKTARQIGDKLLTKVDISYAVQKAIDKRAAKVEVTADDVLSSIKSIRRKAINLNRLSDALKANELLGKHIKLFTEKHEHTVKTTLEDLLAEK